MPGEGRDSSDAVASGYRRGGVSTSRSPLRSFYSECVPAFVDYGMSQIRDKTDRIKLYFPQSWHAGCSRLRFGGVQGGCIMGGQADSVSEAKGDLFCIQHFNLIMRVTFPHIYRLLRLRTNSVEHQAAR